MLGVDVGTGLSFPHYPADVEHLVAVEPEPTMRANAAKAAREVALDVALVDGTADALPAPDASVDAAVVSTGPLFRARPGARFGRAAPGRRAALLRARALAPRAGPAHPARVRRDVWPRMMGGCHLARDTAAAIRAAGFEFRVGPSPAAPHILGAGTAPSELDNVPRAPPIQPRMGPVRAG